MPHSPPRTAIVTDDGPPAPDGVGGPPPCEGAGADAPEPAGGRRRVAWSAVFVASLIAGVPWSVGGPSVDTGDTLAIAGSVTPAELRVGDCLDWPGDTTTPIERLDTRPCSEPHDLEVFALVAYPAASGERYAGDDAIADWAVDACLGRFRSYVGVPIRSTGDLDFTFFWPTDTAWVQRDERMVTCLLRGYDATSPGSTIKLSGTRRMGA